MHIEYLTANKHLLLAAGALIEDDGSGGSGGLLIVDTDDRKEAERFIAEDPFSKAGLFESSDHHALAQGVFQQGTTDLMRIQAKA